MVKDSMKAFLRIQSMSIGGCPEGSNSRLLLLDDVEGMLHLVEQLVQLQVDERHVMFTNVGGTDLEWKKLPKGAFG